jgi:hypothetical protein
VANHEAAEIRAHQRHMADHERAMADHRRTIAIEDHQRLQERHVMRMQELSGLRELGVQVTSGLQGSNASALTPSWQAEFNAEAWFATSAPGTEHSGMEAWSMEH